MNTKEIQDYEKSGEIAKQVIAYAKSIIKPDMLLYDIAEKIEYKIIELGGKIAFPVNLSINDIAAHYTPYQGDETKATGLLKVDIGIHINGRIADTAFSIDLTPDNKYKDLIQASQNALESALKLLEKNPDTNLNNIGKEIQDTITNLGFSPIINLSGHGLDDYDIHAKITIPNYANGSTHILDQGAYAIEPFATTGQGKIYEGAASNIYQVIEPKNTRNPLARKIIEYIWEKNQTLPFSLREIQKKFPNPGVRFALKLLEQENIIHHFPQLIEKSHEPVSQAEHTLIKSKDKITITTK